MRIATLAALLAMILSVQPALGAEGPRIKFDRQSHDYGRVLYGETVTEEFSFTNEGDQTLIIDKLEASCGCTKAIKGSSEIPPKGKSKIVAAFDSTGLKPGAKVKKITVYTNDPKSPHVELVLRADIIRELTIEPPQLARKVPQLTEELQFSVKLTNSSNTPYTIKGLKSDSPQMDAVLNTQHPTIGPKLTMVIMIVLKPKDVAGNPFVMGKLTLLTDHPKEGEMEIPFLISVGQITGEEASKPGAKRER